MPNPFLHSPKHVAVKNQRGVLQEIPVVSALFSETMLVSLLVFNKNNPLLELQVTSLQRIWQLVISFNNTLLCRHDVW